MGAALLPVFAIAVCFEVESKKYAKTKKETQVMITCVFSGDPKGNRTPVSAVRGRRLDRLTIGPCCSVVDYSIVICARQVVFSKNISKLM